MIEHFNATHFPYKVELIDGQIILYELLLDNLEEDIDLVDVPKRKLITVCGSTPEKAWETFTNIKFNYDLH